MAETFLAGKVADADDPDVYQVIVHVGTDAITPADPARDPAGGPAGVFRGFVKRFCHPRERTVSDQLACCMQHLYRTCTRPTDGARYVPFWPPASGSLSDNRLTCPNRPALARA
jgi:hypothetical protein